MESNARWFTAPFAPFPRTIRQGVWHAEPLPPHFVTNPNAAVIGERLDRVCGDGFSQADPGAPRSRPAGLERRLDAGPSQRSDHRLQRQADDVASRTADAAHETGSVTLQRIGAGLVERFTGCGVRRGLRRIDGAHRHECRLESVFHDPCHPAPAPIR